jgi:hypothetical protein
MIDAKMLQAMWFNVPSNFKNATEEALNAQVCMHLHVHVRGMACGWRVACMLTRVPSPHIAR